MLPLNAVRASDCASTAWSSERKPDWDQERRERQAREHGRERLEIDLEAEADLDPVARSRAEAQGDVSHTSVEPARQ